ncbi:RecB family exonuclease [Demequina lignilytica]|uniref:PD-(D/E)XK nuclease family protein n=1 Tax=Demequina lignilytica TaxID=3051663 RepID=A0AB35MKU3_9MICO|nr:PD-(D/E)XK nuclease family protein [Demequina sp. SYSU T0a273]MDN4484342.1 PD-(D/E)XK nuclease family protein [Demequina sp. SYSU T0a273]
MPRPPALSPSRAGDFQQCPLLFRYRTVDRLPEPPSAAATLGTLVHAVLERLYDLPAPDRTVEAAQDRLEPEWRRMRDKRPELASLHDDAAAESAWLADGRQRLATYFDLENPQRLEPAGREEFVEVQLEDGPLLRGIVDRIDIAPDGSIRIVDYKTGKTPDPRYGAKKERFQMRFYALVIERIRQRRPALLQLLFLKDGGRLEIRPTGDDIAQVEHEIREVWAEITAAAAAGRFRTRKGPLCGWCSFQDRCPEFGGVELALDPDAVERALGVRPAGS